MQLDLTFPLSSLYNKVSTNGYITFESGRSSPGLSLSSTPIPVLAPFAADIDTQIRGTISYKVITFDGSDSHLLATVSSLIRTNQSVNFYGTEMMAVYYQDVARFGGDFYEVTMIMPCNIPLQQHVSKHYTCTLQHMLNTLCTIPGIYFMCA